MQPAGGAGRRAALVAVTMLAGLPLIGLVGCVGGSGAPTVLVDNTHDEFAASMVDFFPDTVEVHPGDTVRFRQRWTGEPHSVTFGAIFNDELGRIRARLAKAPPPTPQELPELDVLDALPVMLGRPDNEFAVNQNGAQPCFLERGRPPSDPDTSCPQRAQPRFTGRQSYYSSGFIPYGGPRKNQFDVDLADDIKPGSYNFYCNLHGVGQSGTIRVVAENTSIESPSRARRRGLAQAKAQYSAPLAGAFASARAGALPLEGVTYRPPLAGAATTGVRPWAGPVHRRHFEHRHGSVNEFIPRQLRVRVGEPVTWTFIGRHTVSFNVPAYLPVFARDVDGAVRLDARVYEPVGWSIPTEKPPDAPVLVDAGAWDGVGFRSTGLDWRAGDQFRLSFSRPGTYVLACLIHPAMVGTVVVGS